jgi:hypothetical protein
MSKNQIAGKYISSINDLLGLSIKPQPIYQSKGLKTHMLKSKHYIALKYIDKISEILEKPDYILPQCMIYPEINWTECYMPTKS